MKLVTVEMETIKAAMERARTLHDDWQAECLEIILIPSIYKRWRELNDRFPYELTRHPGLPYLRRTREMNEQVTDWSVFAGYVLRGWNVVSTGRDRGYSHSAGTAWDGVRRDTISQFAHDLRMLAYGHDHREMQNNLERCGISLTGQLSLV